MGIEEGGGEGGGGGGEVFEVDLLLFLLSLADVVGSLLSPCTFHSLSISS